MLSECDKMIRYTCLITNPYSNVHFENNQAQSGEYCQWFRLRWFFKKPTPMLQLAFSLMFSSFCHGI